MNHRADLEPAPLLLVVIPFSAGILFSRILSSGAFPGLYWIYSLVLFSLFLFITPIISHDDSGAVPLDKRGLSGLVFCLVFIFLLGLFHERASEGRLFKEQALLLNLAEKGGEHVFTGIVSKSPVPSVAGCKTQVFVYTVDSPEGSRPVMERLYMTFKGISWMELEPGASLRFAARLFEIRNFKTPGALDIENHWLIRGIKVRGICGSSQKLITVPSKSGAPSVFLWIELKIEKLRHRIMKSIFFSFEKEDERAIAMAILTGERAWFTDQLRDSFGVSGLGHLLAVSGLHMALVAIFSVTFVRLLLSLSQWVLLNMNVRMISCGTAIFSCLTYAAIAGFSPSSLRSFFMVLLIGVSLVFGRLASMKNSLALAAICLLLISPFYLFDISFQLSFFVVFFLIHFSDHLMFSGSRLRRWTKETMALSIAAFVFSSPLVAFYFQRFSILAVPLNFLAVPLTEFLLLPMLLMGLMPAICFPGLPNPFWNMGERAIEVLVKLSSFSTQIQGESSYIIPPSIGQICLVAAIFLLLPLCRRKVFLRGVVLVCIIALASLTGLRLYGNNTSKGLCLHVPDVGQGLCQILQMPGGKVMVVDGGGLGSIDVGRAVVGPYLRRLGIRRIDILAISHPEQDHMGGVPTLLRQFDIGQLWLGQDDNPSLGSWKETMEIARKRHIPVRRWIRNARVVLPGDVSATILPCQGCQAIHSRNSRCVVFRIGYKTRHILLPGDIDKWREKRIASSVSLVSDVLVVPHHGSRTSSSLPFLKAVSPGVAICPVGYHNRFHLPSKRVIERYERLDVPVFRTDVDGTIDVQISEDEKIQVSSFTGRRLRL